MDRKNYQEAIDFFKQSSVIEPHFKTLELLGECYYLTKRFKDAIIPLAAAATLNNQIRAKALLAKALLETGDTHRSHELARQVLAESPENTLAREIVGE